MSAREVELTGGAPWGFRMHGGVDQNQPLRISRVNPGRKASLSGIREGDVITSINGQHTKSMSNSDAHAMLRSAGPVLRLGLNEDREMSPRRRSIGKAGELKRPSQLITDFSSDIAIPQAPVYASIRTVNSPQNKPSSSQSSTLSSTTLVRTAINEEPLKFHPTNPFFTTLPSNYTSASKLPIPNGRLPNSSLDKNRYNSTVSKNGSQPDLNELESTRNSRPNSMQFYNDIRTKYETIPKISVNDFETNENRSEFRNQVTSDPGDNIFQENKNTNRKTITDRNEQSETKQELVKQSTVTESKISEVEEIKTVKKFILNGTNNFEDMDKVKCYSSENIKSDCNGLQQNFFSDQFDSFLTPSTDKLMRSQQVYSGLLQSPSKMQSTQNFANDKLSGETQSRNIEAGLNASSPSASATVAETTKPVWRPGASPAPIRSESPSAPPPPPPPPVWSPSAAPSPQSQRKTFRPVHFEESPPTRRKASADQNGCTSGSENEGRLKTSHSAPVTGLNSLGGNSTSRLPRAQNPTVTLLQKAREGHLSQSSSYIQQERDPRLPRDRPSPPRGDPVYALRKEYVSEGEERRHYEADTRKMSDAHKKIDGVGPTTKDGMPVTLRSEVKDPSRWYKKMYDTIHKNKYDDDYVTVRYKNRRGETMQRPSSNRSQYAYFDPRSGYLSEPEGRLSRLASSTWSDAYDSDIASGPRRRTASVQEERRNDVESPYQPNKYSTLASARASQEVFKSQPGRIENYVPGRSSVIDKEAKQWWDEVMDIFDGWLDENSPLPPYTTLLARAIQKSNMSNSSLPQASPKQKKDLTSAILSKSNMARALKESGYESDSTLIFRRREETDGPLSPAERRAAYKDLQAGGEPPMRGFRSPAPPRQDETEIEYIPISTTLTKIRIHKAQPNVPEVICYPAANIESNQHEEKSNGECKNMYEHPPAPPRRVSSKNSRTLLLVTSTKPCTKSPTRDNKEQSKVDFLKDRISNKLNRQNTHIILKRGSSTIVGKSISSRAMSSSAPPDINRNKSSKLTNTIQNNVLKPSKHLGTSSFSSPRRTTLISDYVVGGNKLGEQQRSVIIEGGVGRRTPITNILDKVTSLDKLWSSQKRNERIDVSKLKSKNISKTTASKPTTSGVSQMKTSSIVKQSPPVTHKSRDMLRTSEKIQRLKSLGQHTKSSPNLLKSDIKLSKGNLSAKTISKSTSNVAPLSKYQNTRQVKTAVITNLKKKKTVPNPITKPPRASSSEKKISIGRTKEIDKNIKKSDKVKKDSVKFKSNIAEDIESSDKFGSDINKVDEYIYIKKRKQNKEIANMHKNIVSDAFFQHLFLRNIEVQSSKYMSDETNASIVLEKAKLFQSLPDKNVNYSNTNSLNTYLIHKKPVSLSRFIMWDRNPSPVSLQKPRSISWPGKMDGEIRKFESLIKYNNEMGSTSSLTSLRSRSEPPTHKLYFSQTSRPVSPTVIFHKKISSQKLHDAETNIKNINYQTNIQAKLNKITHTSKSPIRNELFDPRYSHTSRSVSPQVNTSLRSQSTSPVSIRSPCYRRIYSSRVQNKIDKINKKETRTVYVDDVVGKRLNHDISRVNSEPNLYNEDPDYEEYIRDIQSTKSRSERFRELNRYYAYLERVAELEKTTSSNDSIVRKRDEEIIDFDRWKKIRAIERAEEELNNLYDKLKKAQRDNDVLFYPRDVKDFRWNFDSERGLKIKEKSVEDIKDELQQKSYNDYSGLEFEKSTDTYKPLWRAKSVAETAFDINNKNPKTREKGKPIKPQFMFQEDSFQDLRKKIGIGNRLWSSLSIDQVSALKTQLNAIYSKELESKAAKRNEDEKYTIEVNNKLKIKDPNLQVRCSSLGAPRSINNDSEVINKSESIAALNCHNRSEKEIKNNVNKMQMSLSENEKKQISQNISKEVLNKLHKFETMPTDNIGHNNETRSPIDFPSIDQESHKEEFSHHLKTNTKQQQHLFPKENISNQSSASETDTGSSDVSTKTVIYKDNKVEVKKKVEYFESVKNSPNQSKTIFHARDNSDDNKIILDKNDQQGQEKSSEKTQIFQSQSCTNIKELFGESVKNSFMSLPVKPVLFSRSPSPYSDSRERDRCTPDTLLYSSNETICRSRSPSPVTERYWRAYLKLTRGGEVRRLVRRFDSPSTLGATLRRHRSDPEIARNEFKNNWVTIEGDPSRREKCKTSITVARVPLRPTNRFMPHIDIISKLAALRRRPSTRSRSAEEAIECRPGEVERIRRKFETLSLLGQIYSSAPDVRELTEFPFLAGQWIAHKYPKPSDNNRSIADPDKFVRGRSSPIKKEVKRSAVKEPLKLSSILKPDTLSKQAFNAEAHRPASRYEPPRTPPRPPPAAWPYRLAPYVTPSRQTVTFQEIDSAPEPPRRTAHASYSDTESPSRRYVESDVNIHYRCPVRHDPLPLVPERELARQQAEHMKRLYREQKRNKYLQDYNIHPLDIEAFDASIKELQDMQSRRHQDNFMPSQKSVVPLNRYDDADKTIARALYTFNGQTSRELSFRKGDFINVRRQIDTNWYEGEIHGRIGLFPYNYVELLKGDGSRSPMKATIIEGRARAKFDFTAQTNLELPLKKGEIVVLTRRIDHNWWEGRNSTRTGIFPDSYVTILQEPSQSKPEAQPILTTDKPVASPAAHGLINGSDKRSMGSHCYTPQPNSPALANAPPATQPLSGYTSNKQTQGTLTPSERGYGPPTVAAVDLNNTEPLYVDTNAEAIPYRAMYKYRPQNPDELELNEGDTVYVLEKCDDGWYVGSSQRTGRFGTFPGNYQYFNCRNVNGNYVERI